jgi:hypothetical protein
MAKCEGMEVTANFVAQHHSMSDPLASSAGLIVIRGGFEALTFNVKTHQFPSLKNDDIETSLPLGIKTESASRLQVLQSLPVTLIERGNGITTDMIDVILKDPKINGHLTVDFYTGDGDVSEMTHHSQIVHSLIKVEEGMEGDSEGTTTSFTRSITLSGMLQCKESDSHKNENATAIGTLKVLPIVE